MKLNYERFYRFAGILNPNKLAVPRIRAIGKLDLPQNSVFHNVNTDYDEVIGMLPKSHYATNKQHQIGLLFEHDYGPSTLQGKLPYGVISLHRHSLFPIENVWFANNSEYKNLRKNQNIANEKNNLIIRDYTLIPTLVAYRENQMAFYHKWANLFTSVIDNINKLSALSDRQHFIQIDVPEVLPPVSMFKGVDKDYEREEPVVDDIYIRRDYWKHFQRYNSLTVADLWVWLGTNRNKSKLAQLTELARTRTNLIFVANGVFTLINLDQLDKWLIKPDVKNKDARLPANVAKLRLLGLLMTLNNNRYTVIDESEMDIVDSDTDTEVTIDASAAVDQLLKEENERDINSPSKITDVLGDLAPVVRRLDVDLDRMADSKAEDVNVDVTATQFSGAGKTKVLAKDIGDGLTNSPEAVEDEQFMVDFSDAELLKELEQLEYTYKQQEINEAYGDDYEVYKPPSTDPEEAIYEAAMQVAGRSLLSEAELRRLIKKSGNYKNLPDPWGGEGTFDQAITIKPEELSIGEFTPVVDKKIPTVLDRSMYSSSIYKMNEQYINNVLRKDIGQALLSVQQAGVILEDIRVTPVDNYTDSYDIVSVRLVPVRGQPSTINLQVPRINEDGTFKAGGVRYRMRTQRGDLPIRKTAPNKVALTSYYSKLFVNRSERRTFNYGIWITSRIIKLGWSDDPIVTDIVLSDVTNKDFKGSRVYSAIAQKIKSFKSKGFIWNFDIKDIHKLFENTVPKVSVPVARNPTTGEWLQLLPNGDLLKYSSNNSNVNIGRIEEWFGLDANSAPLDMAEMRVFGKKPPVGIILAQHTGLGSLLKTLGTKYRVVKKGAKISLAPYEYTIRFEDETLVLDRRDQLSTMILSGFNRYHQDIKQFSRYAFDKRDVYGVIFERAGMGSRKTRDADFMFKMWVDNITRDLLIDMGKPTDLFNLFIEACRMLLDDSYNDETDMAFMRDKGYERIPGMIYTELTNAIRTFNSKPNAVNSSIQVNPLSVWMQVQTDQSVTAIDESNPIQSLKDLEVVVFRGVGGRSSVSMTAPSRTVHDNAMGIVSEASVDNGDVGTISFTSADPNYTSVRGTTRRLTDPQNQRSKLVSTSMLMAPGADMDDPKRINFISIQNSQSTFILDQEVMPLRTGYESIIGHRTGELYCKTAKRPGGIVKSVKNNIIIVEYPDGSMERYEYGRVFGKWSGEIVPHSLVTDLKLGEVIEVGRPIVYNDNYFKPDPLSPKDVIYTSGILARTLFWESPETFEDSVALSADFAKRMITRSTEVRNIKVLFTQEIKDLVNVGDQLDSNSILCTIYEPLEGAMDFYEDDALNTLAQISSLNPRAEMRGTVERIEAIYTGDLENMTPSLQEIVNTSDTALYRKNKLLGLRNATGLVDAGYRVDNSAVGNETVIVRVYITRDVDMGYADKLVIGHQMKGTIGAIFDPRVRTINGERIDAINSFDSLQRRMVLSAVFEGSTNSILVKLTDLFVEAWDS